MDLNKKLSPNFTLGEMVRSQIAIRKGISNIPNEEQIENLTALCKDILQPIRTGARKISSGAIIFVSSGFRSKKLNNAIGGSSKKSQHMKGEAADIIPTKMNLEVLWRWIVVESGLDFDQCIYEYGGWIHVSYKKEGNNRKEILSVEKKGRKDIWIKYTKQEILNGKNTL